jgi:predicted DNA-binding helix-hairpin-helix protein
VDVNTASRRDLLRIPGLGTIGVKRVLDCRAEGGRIHSLSELRCIAPRAMEAAQYVKFGRPRGPQKPPEFRLVS